MSILQVAFLLLFNNITHGNENNARMYIYITLYYIIYDTDTGDNIFLEILSGKC